MSLIKLSYFFLLALFGILACIYFEAELIAIYTWHDHKLFPYSKFYGEMVVSVYIFSSSPRP